MGGQVGGRLGWQAEGLPHGAGLVRTAGGAQEEEVLEGAVIRQMEARFVSIEKSQLGGRGEFPEGGGDAAQIVASRRGGQLVFEKDALDGPGATHAPVGSGHFLDHAAFDVIDGAEALQVLREDVFKAFPGLAGEDHTIGEEAVAYSIPGRAELAFRGGGATGETPVGTRREGSS